ncbi:MAG: ABC transporter permease [Acidisphaera sp.]|nr:ABC transporter permease [Acidisphaera sp.]
MASSAAHGAVAPPRTGRPTGRPTGRRPGRRAPLALLLKCGSVGVFLLAWYAATRSGWISPVFLPSPGDVLAQATALLRSGDLLNAVLVSSGRVFAGFALAGLVAVPLGIVMAVWWPARAIMDPFVSLLRPLPSITWIPLTILWLGIGESQKVAIVFLGSWIYVLFYTLASVRRVDPILIRAARNLGASDFAVMTQVILPASLPGIIAGLKITLAISWSCVLSAEMIAAQTGLGALIWQGKDWGDLATVLVGMVGISITVLVADGLAERLERLLLPWERHRRP